MITKNRILFIIGLLIMALPFLGFPGSYESFFQIIVGLIVVAFSFLYARDKHLRQIQGEEQRHGLETDAYAQNQPGQFTDIPSIVDRSSKF